MRIRIWELCNREYVRILAKEEDHELRTLMTLSIRKGIRFCPLEYLKTTGRHFIDLYIEIHPSVKCSVIIS